MTSVMEYLVGGYAVPNKRAKDRKRARIAVNIKNKTEGRTARQHAKFLKKSQRIN